MIHSDLCGALPKSVGGSEYLMSFTDRWPKYMFVYLLKKKSDTVDAFREFLGLFYRQFAPIRAIMSDNDEFRRRSEVAAQYGIKVS